MTAPKYSSSELSKLYPEKKEDQNLHDKKMIEALKKRLNQQLEQDPKLVKKAALILESWLHQKKKK